MADGQVPRAQRFERRMTDAEALMWNVDKDPWLNPSGGSVLILEGPIDGADFERRIAHAVAEVPRLRERVVSTLGRLSPPMWRTDPEFDLSFHVRRLALAQPGSTRQLLDLVATLYQDPYDRSRPLWQFFVIDGLDGGRSALFWKIHHAIADGIGLGYLAEYHIQRTAEPDSVPEVDVHDVVRAALEAEHSDERDRPGLAAAVVRTAGHTVRRQAGVARRLASEVVMWSANPYRARDAAGNVLATVQQVRGQLFGEGDPHAGSPLWRQRSRHRRLELLEVPLEPARDAAKALGGTLNDLFVTGAVGGSLAYHERRGTAVEALNISFVVSTRTDKAIGGNAFTPTRLQVPGGKMDPADRFAEISARMAAKRADVRGQGMLTNLAGIANLLPTSFVTSLARSQAVKQDFATSNLRGPRTTRYVSGARVIGNYPIGPLAGTAFNLTTLSYVDHLDMGLFVDPSAVAEPEELRDDILEAYRQLLTAAGTNG